MLENQGFPEPTYEVGGKKRDKKWKGKEVLKAKRREN
jgi:hypothetical protein